MRGLKIFCDGGSRGNPGPAASAFVVKDGHTVLHKGSSYLGKTTNNIAEYKSVIMALTWLHKNSKKKTSITLILDSQLVVKQLNGDYKIKNKTLKELAFFIKRLERKIESTVTYQWYPRSKNRVADRLVNIELDKVKK